MIASLEYQDKLRLFNKLFVYVSPEKGGLWSFEGCLGVYAKIFAKSWIVSHILFRKTFRQSLFSCDLEWSQKADL